MDGEDGGLVEPVERGAQAAAIGIALPFADAAPHELAQVVVGVGMIGVSVGLEGHRQAFAQPPPQLGCGGIGEGDDENAPDVEPRQHAAHGQRRDRERLARARARLDELQAGQRRRERIELPHSSSR